MLVLRVIALGDACAAYYCWVGCEFGIVTALLYCVSVSIVRAIREWVCVVL